MCFIIIHSSTFEYFLYVHIIFNKVTKQGILHHYMLLLSYTLKLNKRPVKKLRKYFQVNDNS